MLINDMIKSNVRSSTDDLILTKGIPLMFSLVHKLSLLLFFSLSLTPGFASQDIVEEQTTVSNSQSLSLSATDDADKKVKVCCSLTNVKTLKSYGMLEQDRDYSKKSTFVLYRDLTEEVLNRTIFGLLYWPFGIKVL